MRVVITDQQESCYRKPAKDQTLLLPIPFQGMGEQRNSAETQQSGRTPKSGPEIKDGKNTGSAKDRAPERLRFGTFQNDGS